MIDKLKSEESNSPSSLFHRVVKGGVWVFSLRIAERIFYLIRLIILARILAPHDFGLMGIALLTMATLETFSQTGFQAALIQKKENTEDYLNSAWTVMIIRGFILFMILYFIAPHVATFFREPQAKLIIQIIGLSILIHAFTNIGIVYFQKELEFNKQFVYQFFGTFTDFVVAVSAALIIRNVWAIVFGLLAGNSARLAMSYLIHPYRPHVSLDFSKVKELFGFGKWVLGSSVLVFLVTQGDSVLVGKLLGVAVLGFYQMAYKISNTPTSEITNVISQVTFPAYSKLQDNLPKLTEAYLKVLQLISYLSFLIAGLIFALAPDFTRAFLGEKWMPMVPAMQVLAFAGLSRSIAATSGFIFYGVGKPKVDTKLQIIRLFILALLIYPFTIKWGILGTSFVVFLSIFISSIGFSYYAIKITKCGIKDFTKTIVIPLINAAFVTVLILGSKSIISSGIWRFIIFTGLGFSTYFIMTYISDKLFNYNMHALIKESFQSLRAV
jgi:lipopolysaccharide exporter